VVKLSTGLIIYTAIQNVNRAFASGIFLQDWSYGYRIVGIGEGYSKRDFSSGGIFLSARSFSQRLILDEMEAYYYARLLILVSRCGWKLRMIHENNPGMKNIEVGLSTVKLMSKGKFLFEPDSWRRRPKRWSRDVSGISTLNLRAEPVIYYMKERWNHVPIGTKSGRRKMSSEWRYSGRQNLPFEIFRDSEKMCCGFALRGIVGHEIRFLKQRQNSMLFKEEPNFQWTILSDRLEAVRVKGDSLSHARRTATRDSRGVRSIRDYVVGVNG
jgi:hypothetical protein